MTPSPYKLNNNYRRGPSISRSPEWFREFIQILKKHTSTRVVLYDRINKECYRCFCPKYGLMVTISFVNGCLCASLYEKKCGRLNEPIPDYVLVDDYIVPEGVYPSNSRVLEIFKICANHLAKETYLSDPNFKKSIVADSWIDNAEYVGCLILTAYTDEGQLFVTTANANLNVVKIDKELCSNIPTKNLVGSWLLIGKAGATHIVSAFDFTVYFEKV
jgi:hypothetical protein